MNKEISKIHFITGTSSKSTINEIKEACKGGIKWIQLRLKEVSKDELYTIAREAKEICDSHSCTLIINDHVDIVKKINASGVHLGNTDMSASDARVILGNNFIIGGTANTFEDIIELVEKNVDYIGLGPFQFTNTKLNLSPIIGINGYSEIIQKCKDYNIETPIIAIGGIEQKHIEEILNTGIYGIAISGFIAKAENISKASEIIIKEVISTK